jgi:hypothetical protein
MHISGTNGASYALLLARSKTADTTSAAVPGNSSEDSAATQFRSFMQQSPAEQMQTAWLARHGISKEAFAAMDPSEKKKLMEEMKHDIEEQAKQNASAVHTPTNILA